MTTKLTWYGHAAFRLDVGGHRILIDPFLTGSALAPISADDVDTNYILITHGHGDHVGDAISIAQRTNALVISNFEICNWLQAQGVERTHAQHIGGGYPHPFGYLKLTIAHHGSSLPDGSYGGNPAGLLLTIEGKKLYFAGDTGLFYSMRLIGEEGIDLAVLPIGDNFTMGPDDALRAVQLIAPRVVIPIHYNTFEVIQQDPHAWAERVSNETSAQAIVLEPGGNLQL
ncbi:MAG: metal-dependent hydrolase [Anaerolineae bacterium]|jgi:L-ascorbate metabolism protein UlaG (beta-lactamase superfamily)